MILCTQALSKNYKAGTPFSVQAVVDITVEIPQARITLIRGPSGSGKTTLLCLLGTLLRPSSGKVLIEGRDVSLFSDAELTRIRRTHFGFVFQGFHLVPGLKAWQNVCFPLIPCVPSESARKQRAFELLAQLDLAERGDHRPEELSGGEQQRIAIARALVASPRIILADEPTSNIDESSIANLKDVFEKLKKAGTTIVIVSHDVRVMSWADHVFELSNGRLAA